ncbi:MAG: OmpH family outer membrane protein [Acidaminococcaceae bacterium]|jgi:outer membrane protein|nr:OmpH family outer membrane protein [Acidaminococcaceae bacterium]
MKKLLVLVVVVMAAFSFGCGRNAAFGVVDMTKVQSESQVFKDTAKNMQDQAKLLQDEMQKETTGKSQEEAQKIVQEKSAKMQALQSAAQNKLKQSFETAAASVAQEKKLSAILIKEAVPQGGTDVTEDIIKKMQ